MVSRLSSLEGMVLPRTTKANILIQALGILGLATSEPGKHPWSFTRLVQSTMNRVRLWSQINVCSDPSFTFTHSVALTSAFSLFEPWFSPVQKGLTMLSRKLERCSTGKKLHRQICSYHDSDDLIISGLRGQTLILFPSY